MKRALLAALGVVAFLACLLASSKAGDDSYRDLVERWRQKREADLKADDGWLTVSGLFWLKPGETKIGGDPTNDVLLPARAPAFLGTLTLAQGQAVFQTAPGVAIKRNGMAFESGPIHSDCDEHPDTLAAGDLKLILLKRGERYALRLKDNQSPLRTSFAGLRWYPAREEWRVQAKFIAYPAPTQLVLDTIVGETEVTESPGYVSFERDGKEFRLQAIGQKNGTLWFVFRDGTSGRTTHSGARQLYADAPRGGIVTLDFNKATNLPCAYIPYATCPLAPRQNRLGLAIEAGELKYDAGRSDGSPVASGRSS
jgi:uncharacterized protein (DUF1684 family)